MGSVPVRQHALEVRKDIGNRLRAERDGQSFTTEVIKGMSVTRELFQIAHHSIRCIFSPNVWFPFNLEV